MSKYDKELDTRTEEYEKAIEPLERETHRGEGNEQRVREAHRGEGKQKDRNDDREREPDANERD
jgi:hypothetical protein